jgi:hypothetical protein
MTTPTTTESTTPMPCSICGELVLSGTSCHEQCGGYLSASPREYALWAAHHIEKLLSPLRLPNNQLKQRPRTVEGLWRCIRPEYRGRVFEQALGLLYDAEKITYAHGKIRLLPPKRVRRRPARDDGSIDGLFAMPERVSKENAGSAAKENAGNKSKRVVQ